MAYRTSHGVPLQHAGDGAAAHTTTGTWAIDPTIWRVVGTPLIAATHPGPLSGMGVAVKDLYAVAGQRVGAGNPTYLAEAPVQEHSAPAVQRLLDAGADVIGIARTDEFAYSLAGVNAHYGTPPNPKAPGHVPGGSSSGPASAVASTQAAIGLGTDTAGSIRIPSAYQGLWGLRTTHGRISREGVHPLSGSFDTVGWMTRDAQTMDAVTQAMLPDRDTAALSGEVAVCVLPSQMVDADVAEAFGRSCDLMRNATLVSGRARPDMWDELTLDADMFDGFLDIFSVVRGYEAWQANGGWVRGHFDAIAPDIAQRFRNDALIDETAYRQGLERLERSRAMVRSLVSDRVLLMPTAATVAPTITEQDDPDTAARTRKQTMRLTSLAGIGGLPALNMPIATAQGLPCGMCLIGPAGSDKALVTFGKELYRQLSA
ncbi:amidase family protein [Bifidobacterium thermophilum]|uniref:Glutamyl-tRNA amidotransferase n=1 Tax=Bifidobacterium thermophilum TaxID=33905 RepID=A0A7X9RKK2_9BIFI|nr:amidase family protein [Bifidobacterium thermophilum]NME61608.1 glutamyl-tRNA amidotransferase [Bifidobacterium thermophilum]